MGKYFVVDDLEASNRNFADVKSLVNCDIIFPTDPSDARTVLWEFKANATSISGVILDLGLRPNEPNKFDGLDLAIAIRRTAEMFGNKNMPIVAYSSSERALLSLVPFCDIADSNIFLVPKAYPYEGEGTVAERVLTSLISGDYSWFSEPRAFLEKRRKSTAVVVKIKRGLHVSPKGEHDDNWFSGFEKMLTNAFSTYDEVNYDYLQGKDGALRKGFSGATIFRITASRSANLAKHFVVKAGTTLSTEIKNYWQFGDAIRNSIPNCFGLWTSDGIDLAVFELVRPNVARTTFGYSPVDYSTTFSREAAEGSKRRDDETVCQAYSEKLDGRMNALTCALGGWHERLAETKESPRLRECYQNWNTTKTGTVLGDAASRAKSLFGVDITCDADTVDAQVVGIPAALRIPNPLHIADRLLESHSETLCATSVIHGDLHSGNILQRDHQNWTLIDFEHVQATGHVPLDIATLECDFKFQKYPVGSYLNLAERFILECKLLRSFRCSSSPNRLEEVVAASSELNHTAFSPACKLLELEVKSMRSSYLKTQCLIRNYQPPAIRETLIRELHIALLLKSLECFTWYSPLVAIHCWFAACLSAAELEAINC